MVWAGQDASKLQALAGCYALPGNCWAVLSVNHSPSKDAAAAAATPEGYEYKWVILAPGEPPDLRGHRMAGLDNSDDSDVRKQIKADPSGGVHRAHRHNLDWKEIKVVREQEWPVASKGTQLKNPPSTPSDFWQLCMDCLSDTLTALGLEMPTEEDLSASCVSEQQFRKNQRILRQGPEPELAP